MKKLTIVLLLLFSFFIVGGCTPKSHVHDFSKEVVDSKFLKSEATCTSPAFYFKSCECGQKGEDTFTNGAALGHNYSQKWEHNEIKHWYDCLNGCGEKKDETAHTFDTVTVIIEASCSIEGKKELKCSICGYVKTEIIPMTDHTYESSWTTNSTHHWHKSTCSHNDKIDGYAEHTWSDWTIVKDSTETELGIKTRTCNICNYADNVTIPYKEHVHLFKEIVKEDCLKASATCITAAIYYQSCECGEKSTETFNVGEELGHSFANYLIDNNATCDDDGTKSAKCDRCDEIDTIVDVGSKLPHTYATLWSSDDTHHWHEATCQHTSEIKDKELHFMVDTGKIITVATEVSDGEKEQMCSVCDKIKIVSYKYNEHVHSFLETWTSDETHHWHQAKCEHTELTIEKAEHTWSEWKIVKEATTYETGFRTKECIVCKKEVNEEIPMIPSFKVEFLDYDGSIFDIEYVEQNTYVSSPIETPTRTNYRFDGWYLNDTKLTSDFKIKVTSDLTIQARFIRQYTVRFVNYDGTLIEAKKVDEGANVIYPTHPNNRIGYTQNGWDKSNMNIINDVVITALYNINYYNVKFIMPDGTIIDEQSVPYKHSAINPNNVPPYFSTWNKSYPGYLAYSVYENQTWDKDFNEITKDTIITAVYNYLVEDTILSIKDVKIKTSSSTQTVKMTVFIYSNEPIYGLNFKLNYATYNLEGNKTGNIYISDKKDASGNYLSINHQNGYNTQYSDLIDANNYEYSFAWSNGKGVDGKNIIPNGTNGFISVVEIEFTIAPLTQAGEYLTAITEDSYFIGSQLIKEKPIMISGKIIIED